MAFLVVSWLKHEVKKIKMFGKEFLAFYEKTCKKWSEWEGTFLYELKTFWLFDFFSDFLAKITSSQTRP